jgi:hypothetical protein
MYLKNPHYIHLTKLLEREKMKFHKNILLAFLLITLNFLNGEDDSEKDKVFDGDLNEILTKFHEKPYDFLYQNGGKVVRLLDSLNKYNTTYINDVGAFQLNRKDKEIDININFAYILGSCYAQEISKENYADKYVGVLYALILYTDMKKVKKDFKDETMEGLLKNHMNDILLESIQKFENEFKLKLHLKLRDYITRLDKLSIEKYLGSNEVDLEWCAFDHSDIAYNSNIIDYANAQFGIIKNEEDKNKLFMIIQILKKYKEEKKKVKK